MRMRGKARAEGKGKKRQGDPRRIMQLVVVHVCMLLFCAALPSAIAERNEVRETTILRAWNVSKADGCSIGFAEPLYECALAGFGVSWSSSSSSSSSSSPIEGAPSFAYLPDADGKLVTSQGQDCDLFRPSYTHYSSSGNFIILEYRDASSQDKSMAAQLAPREDGLGFRWRLLNTGCEISFGAEQGGELFGMKHMAQLKGYQTSESFCLDSDSCAYKCSLAGFAVHLSSERAVMVPHPSKLSEGCTCGVAVLDLNSKYKTSPSGRVLYPRSLSCTSDLRH
eukprot:2245380-Rhodomonas_salina.1